MADFRPMTALRYDTAVAGDAANLVAPPYDVVSEAEARALYARSPYNVARVENGETRAGDTDASNRYVRAHEDIEAWLAKGALKKDATPHLYVYDQSFEYNGATRRRRAVFGALRVEEWDKGIVLPHEHTGAAAKEDRLRLLRATRVELSPVLALYRDVAGAEIADADLETPVFDAVLPGERHTLRPLAPGAAQRFHAVLADQRLYIADGHHRYETALNYRNECRTKAASWSGEEPENFTLAALVDAADPGLVVLPIHRLLRLSKHDGLLRALGALFHVEEAKGADALTKLQQALAIAGRGGPAYGVVGAERGKLHLLAARSPNKKIDALVPAGYPEAWRALDVAVLHHAALPTIKFEQTPDNIAFTEDAEEAAAEVKAGRWDAAFLLNPTRVDQIIDVAEAGERMPQKSTFFYPKLGTGLMMLPLD